MAIKKYILGLLLFGILLAGAYFLAIRQLTNGYVDKYYPKFTQEAGSMIIGLSRAQYGLVPSVIEEAFPNRKQPVVNFAFEIYQSAYGDVLLEDVKNKLSTATKEGIFILEVSPGSFLIPKVITEEEVEEIDGKTILGKMAQVKKKPNYEYIRKCYGSALYKGVFRMKPFGNITVHNDGWVAFADQYDDYTVSESMIADWKKQTLESYDKVISVQKKSQSRIKSFVEMVRFLKKHGTVHIVRMPATKEIIAFENKYWEDFDALITTIASNEKVSFLNYTQSETLHRFYDGSHLFSESAKDFTKQLCEDIKRIQY